MSIEKSEYEVEVFCPKCGSKDVVLNFHLGFFTFNSCNKCSYKIERVNDKVNGL